MSAKVVTLTKEQLGRAMLASWDRGSPVSLPTAVLPAHLQPAQPAPETEQPQEQAASEAEKPDEGDLDAKKIATAHIEALNEQKRLDLAMRQAKLISKQQKLARLQTKNERRALKMKLKGK